MNQVKKVRGGIGDITKADPNARIQDNLYLAVNSDWILKSKIPADRPAISVFSDIDIKIEKDLMRDLANFADNKEQLPDIPNFDKAVAIYRLARDFDKRNADGADPIKDDLSILTALKDLNELNWKLPFLYLRFTLPFNFFVEADRKNTKVNVLHFDRPDLILPDTTSYQNDGAEKLLDIWKEQSIDLLTKAGLEQDQAEKYAIDAINFDAKIVKVAKSAEERADDVALYNPVAISDFEEKTKTVDFDQFFDKSFEKKPERVIVYEPRFLDNFVDLFNEDNFGEIKAWIITNFINANAGYLSQEFREAAFPFRQALYGQKELPSQERSAYLIANQAMSEIVGIYYGKTYFGETAKADVEDMIRKMIAVYEKRIKSNNWLSEETKKKAITKLNALILKIGYPEKANHIYDLIKFNEDTSLYVNLAAQKAIAVQYEFAKLFNPVDRGEWAMPGNLINACYDPQRNDITFPAAILQKPFYSVDQDRSSNYGGIGVVIAHEISHAFDNNGANYDEFGNMKNWWTKQDYAEFKKRIKQEAELFDGIVYGPVKLNGKQTVSENIADQGGVTAAVEANKGENGDMQDLFKNYARIWASKETPEIIKTVLAFDVHAPGPERVNVQAQCQEEFYKAFNVKPTDGMWLDPDKRVIIW